MLNELEQNNLIIELADKNIKSKISLTTNNALQNQLGLEHDLMAASIWLNRYMKSENSFIAYKRELTRFLFWLKYIHGKFLNEITTIDLINYNHFLLNPDPFWCMETKYKRYDLRWRPYRDKLPKSNLNYINTILGSFFSWLHKANYVSHDPTLLLDKTNYLDEIENSRMKIWQRYLQSDEWQALGIALQEMPENTKAAIRYKYTVKLLVGLLYLTGLRINEAREIKYENFQYKEHQCWLIVLGKGQKLGSIPVNNELLQIIEEYKNNVSPENTSGYIFLHNNKVPSVKTLYNMIKKLGQTAKQYVVAETSKEILDKFSPHWLRHLSASHQAEKGTPLHLLKENHRHSSLQTTEIYLHSPDEERQLYMANHSLNLPSVDQNTNNSQLTAKKKNVHNSFVLAFNDNNLSDVKKFTIFNQLKILDCQITNKDHNSCSITINNSDLYSTLKQIKYLGLAWNFSILDQNMNKFELNE